MPKCVFCWAAYASVLSSIGITSLAFVPWMLPVSIALFCLNGYSMWITAKESKAYTPMLMNFMGILVIASQRYIWDEEWILLAGLGLMFSSSFYILLSGKLVCNLKLDRRLLNPEIRN